MDTTNEVYKRWGEGKVRGERKREGKWQGAVREIIRFDGILKLSIKFIFLLHLFS